MLQLVKRRVRTRVERIIFSRAFFLLVMLGVLSYLPAIKRAHDEAELHRLQHEAWLETLKPNADRCHKEHNITRFHFSGEPSSFQWGEVDIRLLTGGANEDREFSFYLPFLIGWLNKIFRPVEERLYGMTPANRRSYADVLYRSSFCDKDRDDAVAVLRRIVENAGYSFVVVGRCAGTGYMETSGWNGRPFWGTKCEECLQSKIMLGFERFTPGKTYLGEKLFLPAEYGAIPAYRGNGHEWMDLLTVNRQFFIDRSEFESDTEFGYAIVELLRNETRLLEMQRAPIFHNPGTAYKRSNFFLRPLDFGPSGAPELYRFIQTSPKFRHLLNRPTLTYRQTREYVNEGLLKVLFNPGQIIRNDTECADVELDWCCA